MRRFRRRETLRVGYNDIVRGLPLELITLDLSHMADACVEAAYRLARRRAEARHGVPRGRDASPARFVVLGLGKLGGEELNYSSDIDLIFLYDDEGQTDGPRAVSNAEFFARMGGDLVRLLADHSSLGQAYRVDMRLRPEGDQGALARSLAATLGYYETTGRTWERQALIKCRPVAGDLDLGREFLDAIEPFVYRRYLGGAEIGEIKALKRRIEERTVSAGTSEVEVKTGHGGIRDVEFVVQFLQLLHGGEYPEVRHANTLIAISRLEQVGCLTAAGARDHGEHLSLPPPGRAPPPDDVRPPDAPDAPRPGRATHPGDPDRLPPRQHLGRPDRPRAAVPERLPRQDRAESEDPQPPPARRLPRRRGGRRRPGRRPGPRPRPRPRARRRRARPVSLRRPPDGLRQPAGPGTRGHPVPLAGAVPALLRGDRPEAAPGRRPDARPRHDADEPGEGLGLAGGQGHPLGALQLQPADPPALRRALRLEPVPLRDPHQQPGDDRRPDGLAGRRPPAALLGDPRRAGRALQGGRGPGPDPAQLPEQGMGADRDARHPRPRAGPRRDPRAGRRRRGDRRPGRPRPVPAPGRPIRHATPPGRRRALAVGDRRAGEVRRARAELPQRPGPDLPPRVRRRDARGAASRSPTTNS